jgi:hypothetical protein
VSPANIGYDDLRLDTVVGVAKLMAAAITPQSGGQLFLTGKHNFMETRRRPASPTTTTPHHTRRNALASGRRGAHTVIAGHLADRKSMTCALSTV